MTAGPGVGSHRTVVTGVVIGLGCREVLEDGDDLVPLSGGGTERDEIASRKLTCRRADHRSTAVAGWTR
jgi:hypothetical protein